MGKCNKKLLNVDFGDFFFFFGAAGCTGGRLLSGSGLKYLKLLHGGEVKFSEVCFPILF